MKARLIRIGNSRGVRLPKPILEEAQLTDEIDIAVRNGAVVISPARKPRAGWAEAAKLAHQRKDDLLLDPPTSTKFDEKDWKW